MINFFMALTASIILTTIYSFFYLRSCGELNHAESINKWLTIDAYAFKGNLKESGLSDRDVQVFRQTMNETIKNIEIIEENLGFTEEFKEGYSILREYFWSIINNPKQLNKANSFNYKYIPNLAKLTKLHREIEETNHVNSEINKVLDKSSKAISMIFENISSDYDSFRKYKVSELSKEAELSKVSKDFNSELDSILKNL